MGAAAPWIVAGALGMLAGMGELLVAFPPRRALRTVWSILYVVVNGAVALLALLVYVLLGGNLPSNSASSRAAWLAVVLIGLGGMALLRATITIHAGGQPFTLPINKVPQMFLDAIRKANVEAQGDLLRDEVEMIMRGVSFSKSFKSLPTYCIREAGNQLDRAQTNRISAFVNNLRDDVMPDDAKAKLMGTYLAQVDAIGASGLKRAVRALGDTIKD